MSTEWIAQGLKKAGKSRKGLAEALGRFPSAITDLLAGKRRLKADEIAVIAAYLDIDPPFGPGDLPGTVPVVGYVGAGAEAVLFSEGQIDPNDRVAAPKGATEQTVAVEIRGESLGALFDRWLVFYDNVRDPPGGSLVNKLCVCWLTDGRVLVKKLIRGGQPGLWTLLSNTEGPIYDVEIERAAKVRTMAPR